MFNFFGVDATTKDVRERCVAYAYNVAWVLTDRRPSDGRGIRCLFLGEDEDIPDRSLCPLLPSPRSHATRYFSFLGHVLPFDAREFAERAARRAQVGYDDGPPIVAAVGGTAIGCGLLELCGRAFSVVRKRLPGARLIRVCVPRIEPTELHLPDGVECRSFIPELYRHFAACHLAIVRAGGPSTLELTALQRPFLYFPLKGHFEREITVAGRLAQHHAGVRMTCSQTTAGLLAEAALAHLGEQPSHPPVLSDGARRAAAILEVAESGR